jgi:1-acyl-sn-glycerol-3-phosphate acyltransferase
MAEDVFYYESKRNNLLVDIGIAFCGVATSVYYQPSYRNIERLKPFRDSGFVLLPNHQSGLDIIFEGLLLHRAIGRKGYYIAKESLPKVLEYGGAVMTIRGKDVTKEESRDKRREMLGKAIERKDYLLKVIEYLLAHDEIVVLHQQGTRADNGEFFINRPNLRKLLMVQERLERQIPFVPLTISYENLREPLSRVIVDVGHPIQVPNNGLEELAEHLKREIQVGL